MNKLTSRKFWICVAAFLGSIATSISGIVTDNKYITTIGVVAGVLSAAIYAFCEAWVDGKAVNSEKLDTLMTLLASSILKNEKEEEDAE